MNGTRDWIVAFALVVSLGANAMAGPLVFCTGTGGHISVESAFADCCRSTQSRCDSRVEGPTGSHVAGCGVCQDLPIPVSPSHDPPPQPGQGGQFPQAPLKGSLLPGCPDIIVAPPCRGALPLPLLGALGNLRTTVLRY
jgi:hypothetical protein